ncbi:hypothetical protein C8F01DRAFT_1084569 [Mycena amicta]|nr:hypothetical protein C8F01DRAFT_1084569 [Mycena amicta]
MHDNALVPPSSVLQSLFPWVEEEIKQLDAREVEPQARDIALRKFLLMLIWFRTVLAQDAALLYTSYPDSPIFSWTPFNSAEFRKFAAGVTDTIARVEQEVALSLKNLPTHIAQTFTAAMARVGMEQQARHNELTMRLEELQNAPVGDDGRSQKRRRLGYDVSPPTLEPPPSIPQCLLFPSTISTPMAPSPPLPAFPTFPTPPLPLPAFPTLDHPFNNQLPVNDQPLTRTHDPSPPPSLQLSPAAIALPSSPPPIAPPQPVHNHSTLSDIQKAEWARLGAKFPDARLRAHRWEWLTGGPKANSYLPYYEYREPLKTICDVWQEYAEGFNGHLSTQQLGQEWGARWRRNQQTLRNQHTRRSKIVTLVNELSVERKWSTERVLRFLREAYDEASPPVYSTILQPASTTHTLRELATRRGFERDNRDARSFLVGVDIGVRVAAIQKNRFNRRFHHVNERNILITFFYQLCSFQRCSATFIFVFDGPGCPRIKRGTQVRMNSSTLIMNLKKLIAAFGYYSHDAPGEAEAELAYLNKFGHIDAILTTDGDVFAFGGLCIIQMNGSKVDEEVPLYEAATFISSPLNLDEAGIILVALLAGGDYDQGIAGCSAEISHRLAKAGFGTTLHTIVTTHTGDTLQYRLEKWRQSIRAQLVSNPSGLLD